MKVVIAIDSFKGSLRSIEAGRAAAEGVRRAVAGANSLNPAAATNFNSHAVMTAVADFYGNPTRGMGIDLYWAVDAFDVFGPNVEIPFFGHVNHVYRHKG